MVETEQLLEELRRALTESETLRESQRRRAARLEKLAEVGAALVSELNRERLVEHIVTTARQVTGATYAALFTRETGPAGYHPIFVPAALDGAPRTMFPDVQRVDPRQLRFEGIFRPLFFEGRRQFVPDVAAEASRHGFPPGHPTIGSYIAEPLFDRERRVLGALLVGDPRPNRFVPDDAELTSLLASQAGVALENARLYEAERQSRRAMEAERELLAEVTARLHSVMDSMRDGLIVFDRTARAVVVNPVIREIFGIQSDPLGWTPADFACEVGRCFADPNVPREIARRTFGYGVAEDRMEFELAWPRRRWIERLVAPIRGRDGLLGLVVVYHDLTERREAERLKDEFLSIASHELRTPLTTVKAHVQMLLRRLEATQEGGEVDLERATLQLRTVDQQANRLARLIDELLDVSRIQTGKLDLDSSPLDLGGLLDQVLGNLALVVETHTLRCEPTQESLPVVGDSGRLEQVLVNLVMNAVRYSEPGTTVTVTARRASGLDGHPVALVLVRDEGVGIVSKDLPHIFDRFYRSEEAASQRHAGLGLGLYISSEIARLHHGRLWAESEPGQGSIFYLELPIAEASDQVSGQA